MTKEKLKIEFGQPEHGWLPVYLRHGDFDLQFEASDVPVNPIGQLISGIRQITHGIGTEVWWHLEPASYYFNFDKRNDEYLLTLLFSKTDDTDKQMVYETNGKYDDIIMPFYRAIKNFSTREIEKIHWPKLEEDEINKLTTIVKG